MADYARERRAAQYIPPAWKFALVFALGVLAVRWNQPLASAHAFRETETAISAYWMTHGGPWLNYWTPVFGPPWRAPFEFPLYQWLCALLSYVIPLDFAGRLVSCGFWLLTLWPLRGIARKWWLDENLVSLLWLVPPIMLYWGTCFLIDTTAIFFGTMFLWLFLTGHRVWSVMAGSISSLVKGTVFVPFAVSSMSPWAIPPLLMGLIWQKWTDWQKPLGTLAGLVNSNQIAQIQHNYGNFGDRLNVPNNIYYNITLVLGQAAIPVLIGLLVCGRRRFLKEHKALVAAPFVVLLVFPRLHYVHEYYWMDVVPFAVLIVAGLMDWPMPRQTVKAFTYAIVVGCAMIFLHNYAYDLRDPQPGKQFGEYVAARTNPNDVLLIYGQAWSPVVPYYAGRKAIMHPDTLETPAEMAFDAWTEKADAVIRCPSKFDGDPVYERIFAKWPNLVAEWKDLRGASCIVATVGPGTESPN